MPTCLAASSTNSCLTRLPFHTEQPHCSRRSMQTRRAAGGEAMDHVGRLLWEPPADVRTRTRMGQFMAWLTDRRGLSFADYAELWRWSVDDLAGFWSAVWEYFDVIAHTPYHQALADPSMPGA